MPSFPSQLPSFPRTSRRCCESCIAVIREVAGLLDAASSPLRGSACPAGTQVFSRLVPSPTSSFRNGPRAQGQVGAWCCLGWEL